jgi:hypothetical protein
LRRASDLIIERVLTRVSARPRLPVTSKDGPRIDIAGAAGARPAPLRSTPDRCGSAERPIGDNATPLAVSVAEPLVLGHSFGTRVDRREIRTLLAEVGYEAPTQMAFHRLSRQRVPPVDELWFVWPSLLIHAESLQGNCDSKAEGLGFVPHDRILGVSLYIGVYDHVLSTERPGHPYERGRTVARTAGRRHRIHHAAAATH